MTHQKSEAPQRLSGRARVLDAAISCFSRASYAEVSLRDLAAAAAVDVAYVHRSYGSKRGLFRAALIEVMQVDQLFAQPCAPEEMIARLSGITAGNAPGSAEVRALDLILHSCASAEPREILREALEAQFLPPLSRILGDEEKVTTSFIVSLLFGVGIMREALAAGPMATLPAERMSALSARIMGDILRGEAQ